MNWLVEEILDYIGIQQSLGEPAVDVDTITYAANWALGSMNDRGYCQVIGANYVRMNLEDRHLIYKDAIEVAKRDAKRK
jgi:hypothetical protein